jgi:redox-sensitive bicupin YhaK (pirin superfamily)
MLKIRPSNERGHANHGWLDTFHTFSFADYHDPAHMGFRALRVINEDRVQAGRGFPTHPHADMEILTFVLAGALTHADSMGTGSTIRPGDVQRMSAGTGVTHSEFNHSKTEPVHFLQIWIMPDTRGLEPAYAQQTFDRDAAGREFVLLASGGNRPGSLSIHQDVNLSVGILKPNEERELQLEPGRHAWIHVARGAVRLNGTELVEGDGAALSLEPRLQFAGIQPAEVLVFDLA